MRDRRVDLEGLLGLLDLLLLRQPVERAHVVQAVGELDQDDPDVRGHRHEHLAVVLGLRLVARLEDDAGELGDAVDEAGDLVAERLADLVQRRGRVLDGVVQQGGAQRLGVQPHAGADLRHADRVHDEVLAGLAALVGVVLAGEHERVDEPRRSIGSAASSACSVTIANRSASSSLLERRQVVRRLDRREVVLAVRAPDGAVLDEVGQHLGVRLGARDRGRGRATGARPRAPPRRRSQAARASMLVVRNVVPLSSRLR